VNYHLRNAQIDDRQIIHNLKLETIIRGNNVSPEEKGRINKYIDESLSTQLPYYKIIMVNEKMAGIYCLYLINNDHDYLLDEIYILDKYKKKGIATSLINNSIKEAQQHQKDLYLWVYKTNLNAINLYKKLGFNIFDETDTRYHMIYETKK